MLKHSFSDFSYAVNFESAKKGHKEILVCFIYNGTEVLKKVYIPEGPGISYVFEARKIIDQQIKSGELASYSHRFVRKNRKKKIQPKKVVAAVNAGKPISVAPVNKSNNNNNKKWVIITAAIAVLAVVGATLTTYFVTKNNTPTPEPQPQPTPPTPSDKYDVVFDESDARVSYVGEGKVKAKEAYTCKIFVSEDQSNYEINKDNFVVYAGKSQLIVGTDYDLSYYEEGTINGLELEIRKGKINGTVFISAKSIERSSLDELYYDIDSSDQKAIITGLKLKAGQDKADITEITIPDVIKDEDGEHEVKEIRIDTENPEYVLGDGLLTGCSSLRKLTIPFVGLRKSITIQPDDPYQEDHLFGAIFGRNTFPNAETLTYQDYWFTQAGAEKETHVLKDFSIPNTLSEVNITHFNKMTYGSSPEIDSIPIGAFSYCVNLTDIKVLDTSSISGASVDRSAFYGCRALRYFTCGENNNDLSSLTVGRNAFNGCGVLTSFDFSAVTEIKEYAFKDCAGMKSVYLPENVTNIEVGAFEGYYGLVKCEPTEKPVGWLDGWVDQLAPVVYGLESEDAEPITSDDGNYSCLITNYEEEQTDEISSAVYIVQYIGDYNDEDINIPKELSFAGEQVPVRYIGSESFMDFNLTPKIIVESDNLISVGPEAFKKCYALQSINFKLGSVAQSKLESIGANAFENCPELVSVDGISNVTSIGNYAFYDCPKLKGESTSKIMNLPNATSVGISAFENDAALTSITLHTNTTDEKGVVFGDYAFRNCSELATINYNAVASEGEYTIPDYCFYGTAIKDIVVPQCTTIVGTAAYAYCQSAETIKFEGTTQNSDNNKVRVIGDSAFLRCIHLNFVGGEEKNVETYLPSTLESIGRAAFQDCFHLYGINCKGAKFKEIPDSMCYGTSNLNHFYYKTSEANFTKIGQFAFAQDQALTLIGDASNKLPSTLIEIGDRAFINCVSLGQVNSSGYEGEPLHIQYPSVAPTMKFKMGQQVFYGWYGQSSQKNILAIDRRWIDNSNKTDWGWQLTHGSGLSYTYNQKGEGWNYNLYITAD